MSGIEEQLQREVERRERAEAALAQRSQELALLNRVSQAFISTLDLDHLLATVLEEVRQLLGVVACSAWLIDPQTGELVCRQVTDPQSTKVRGWRLAPGTGLVGWVAQQGRSLIVGDTHQDERHYNGVDRQTGLALRSILSAPLRVKSGVIGVLQVVDEAVGRFDETDRALLESLAATVAIAIENGRLYEQARQDGETKAILLREVNHRVKNNLAAIVGLLYAEQRHASTADQAAIQSVMDDLVLRIQGLATVHSMLSAAEWAPLLLSELATQVVHTSLQVLPPDKYVSVSVSPSTVRILPKQATSLALVFNELVTNTAKYALADRQNGRIEVDISFEPGSDEAHEMVEVRFRDDGPGYPQQVLQSGEGELGLYLIRRITHKDLRGALALQNDGGAITILRFKYLRKEYRRNDN